MSIRSAIKLPITLPVRINPLTLELLLRDLPGNDTYAKVYIPESTIDGNTTVGEQDHPTPLNLPVWREYVNRVMFDDGVPLSVHGSTVQHLGALHSMITMDKDVPLRGKCISWTIYFYVLTPVALGGFPDFKIMDTSLLLPPKPNGTNLVAKASLPNPSPFILQVVSKSTTHNCINS